MLPVGTGTGLEEVALEGLLEHSTLPNMFTRSMSPTTIGSRVPSAMRGSREAIQCPSASRQVDAPLARVQGDRSKTVLHEANQALGVGRRNSPMLLGLGVPFFLRCQQRRVRVSQRAEDGSVPREMPTNTLVRALWTLLA